MGKSIILKVSLVFINLLLNKDVYVPGWTYLVIVISLTSLFLSFSMYTLQQSINIIHDPEIGPKVSLSFRLQGACKVSISHTNDHALAFAIFSQK